ncbi:MAG: hypothetical protein UV54_C0001G0025 [Candidatus Beckwithbacteria bacterium GW2011_GWA2_43_10]|uniref:Uncharacterized protein n=1 Tax=Candidatus Beckwithbacteria bacterium GW2011_GWA2_43_10 TaxID=1618369 RepID=A0A0G1C4U6_9BACT|nr:MAG: hypothetical protein UV54_C0001G0025 [Candidatus Beckwithbacteria bacterium GW2011_GWA2_43_10]
MKKKNIAKEISAGMFVTGIDLVLFAASLGLNLYTAGFKAKDPIKVLEDSFKLTNWFQEKLLRSCSAYAKSKGYLQRVKEELQLTNKGRDRLVKQLPKYQPRRPWDDRLHLITYDIKETKRQKRHQLMRWLIRKKAVMLQKSVWISVMDMETELRRENLIYQDEGIIICSAVKSGEGINGRPVKELVRQWYRLEELNRRYDHWIGLSKSKKTWAERDKFILKMRYLKILADDPQLPFKLLPGDWLGDEANKLYEQKVNI